MEAKEKAKELVDKFREHAEYWDCYNDEPLEEDHAKQCAIIAVDEVIGVLQKNIGYTQCSIDLEYYQEVKTEIEKL